MFRHAVLHEAAPSPFSSLFPSSAPLPFHKPTLVLFFLLLLPLCPPVVHTALLCCANVDTNRNDRQPSLAGEGGAVEKDSAISSDTLARKLRER